MLDEMAAEGSSIKIGKVNVDEEQLLAIKFGVSSIPTLILFEGGKEKNKLVGLHSREDIKKSLGI